MTGLGKAVVQAVKKALPLTIVLGVHFLWVASGSNLAGAQQGKAAVPGVSLLPSRSTASNKTVEPESENYKLVQRKLARGWNTWDVHSVTTQVLLPEGLAIHIGMKHNSTLFSEAFLTNPLIGRMEKDAERVIPGPHSWDGSYTDLQISWKGHNWRVQSARDGSDLVILAAPLPVNSVPTLPQTIVISVDFLWNLPGTALRHTDFIETRGSSRSVPIYCTCQQLGGEKEDEYVDLPGGGPYFAVDFVEPVGVSTGKRRTVQQIEAVIERQLGAWRQSKETAGKSGLIVDAIETTLGWDTIYDPSRHRVISPVSRIWSVGWGGYVLFDWDTFFAATLASIGDRDLAYANAMEILREETPDGFVPNYARVGGWKSFDRSEPPVGAITVLALFKRFHDRWFLADTFERLLRWNRWWAEHRDIQGYLALGSDPDGMEADWEDKDRRTLKGAILESGLDNSPMYDSVSYNDKLHVLEYADVGLMSLYIADCDALADIANALEKPKEETELRARSSRYKASLATLWDEKTGIFLNKDLQTGKFSSRLSPTNFYPMLAKAATPAQAQTMVEKHLLNPKEFWGEWVIPSIARDDPAFSDQEYWRGRIWGPLNYLVYLGLRNYEDHAVRKEFADKSDDLFMKEWTQNRHVHENYNAISGAGDDVNSSDRFYHWGALLGYVEYMEQTDSTNFAQSVK